MRILAFDFSAMFHRAWEGAAGKEISAAFQRTVQDVTALREGYDRVAILCDGGPSFRKSLLPTYKADRQPNTAMFNEQKTRTLVRLKQDACSVILAPEVGGGNTGFYAEADDLCMALTVWCVENGHSLVIYGGDKDLLQCVDDEHEIVVMRPDHPGVWDEARVLNDPKFGVSPEMIPDLLALGGDKSDGFKMFPGWTDPPEKEGGEDIKRPGIATKGATALLQRFGSIYNVIVAIEGKDGDGLPLMKDGHVKEVLRRGKPTPLEAAQLGMALATLNPLEGLVDFSGLLAEPVYAKVTREPVREVQTTDAQVAQDAPKPTWDEHRATVEAQTGTTYQTIDVLREALPDNRSRAIEIVKDAHSGGINPYALQPRSIADLRSIAVDAYESRLYSNMPNEQSVMMVIAEAIERQIPFATALRQAAIIAGKVAWPSAFIAGLILRSPVCEIFETEETTAERAVLLYKRRGRPEKRYIVTIEDAAAAGDVATGGYIGKWKKENKQIRTMLMWMSKREGGRVGFPDVCANVYSIDELGGNEDMSHGA